MRNFSVWLGQLRESIASYEYYTDFKKVYENISKYKEELDIINTLVGSKNIENDFKNIIKKHPKTIKVIPLLLATRTNNIYAINNDVGGRKYNFATYTLNPDEYCYFMRKTGLFDLLENHIISSLYDYIIGVEVGLDSNARKNRGGHLMEKLVESYIQDTGQKYYKEMYAKEVEELWDCDLSTLTNKGNTSKRWDFVVKTSNNLYLIETNFYASGGSKLNETARSYKMLALEAKELKNIHFVWITDGTGWMSAKNNLQETFETLDNLYNIKELEDGILKKIFQ